MSKQVERNKDTNRAILCGRLMNRFDKGNVIILTISVMEIVRGEQEINYPRVYFFKEEAPKVNQFLVGDEVFIEAHIAAPKKRRPDGTEYVSQELVGDSIRARKVMYPDMVFPKATPKSFMEPQTNMLYCRGPLKETRRMNGGAIGMQIEVEDHGHKNTVELTTWNADTLLMEPGTEVSVYGKIRTRVKGEPGKRPRRFRNMVALVCQKAEKEKDKEEGEGNGKEED